MRALGLVGPMPRLDSKYTWITQLFSIHFFADGEITSPMAKLGDLTVHMKLKIVALAISME